MSGTSAQQGSGAASARPHRPGSDVPFYLMLTVVGGTYVVLLVGMLLADVVYMVSSDSADVMPLPASLEWARPVARPVLPILAAFGKPEIRYSIQLTLVSCCITAIMSVMVAVPLGFAISRYRFPGRELLDAVLDIPIVMPPLVVGLSLLILFQYWPFSTASGWVVTYPSWSTTTLILPAGTPSRRKDPSC